jgi:pre-mRNA-processing factor 6
MMDSRRKRSREQQLLMDQRRSTGRPRIADQFADLKRELSSVTSEQWDAIPEVGTC